MGPRWAKHAFKKVTHGIQGKWFIVYATKCIYQDSRDAVCIPQNIAGEHILCQKESTSSLDDMSFSLMVRAVFMENSQVACPARYLIFMHRHGF